MPVPKETLKRLLQKGGEVEIRLANPINNTKVLFEGEHLPVRDITIKVEAHESWGQATLTLTDDEEQIHTISGPVLFNPMLLLITGEDVRRELEQQSLAERIHFGDKGAFI